jgi:ketosteroid isomerase-like protein
MPEQSTPPGLVELNRRAIESVARRDFAATMAVYGPDSVWDVSAMGMGRQYGSAASRRELESWTGLFEEFEVQIEEILDLGGAATFSVVDQCGRPVGSSASVQMRFASITEWADRTIVRVTAYTDVDEARAAAGRLVESRE